jgi:hypothetical protein
MLLGELAQQLNDQGIACDLVMLDTTNHTVRYRSAVTDQQRAIVEAAMAEWKLQTEAERWEPKAVADARAERAQLATLINQLDQAIIDTADPLTFANLAAAAAEINAIRLRQNKMLRLLRYVLKRV